MTIYVGNSDNVLIYEGLICDYAMCTELANGVLVYGGCGRVEIRPSCPNHYADMAQGTVDQSDVAYVIPFRREDER